MTTTTLYENIRTTVQNISKRIPHFPTPQLGIILGSGLGSVLDQLENTLTIAYQDIPSFPNPTVEGHEGRLVFGFLHQIPIVALQGRTHLYEGYSAQQVVFPTRVICALGIHTLILTNAAGAIHTRLQPQDLMLIEDHLNLTGDNPLRGPNIQELGPRFPDMTETYSKTCLKILEKHAEKLHIHTPKGTYAALLGPTYETPAEIRMLRILQAHAVGMSTVPEAIAAKHLGVRLLGISCITNFAAGLALRPLEHQEVVTHAKVCAKQLGRLLFHAAPELATSHQKGATSK